MNKKVLLINVSITVVILIVSVIARFIINKDNTSISNTMQEQVKESKADSQQTATPQVEPKQEVAKVQAQSVEKPAETQTAEPQTATVPTEPQTQSTASEPNIDYEQKFGNRIYLATKDEFVNMRNAPSGEIVAKIYKKDFADIMLYSFDTNSNEKWLKVVYFPPNVKDEQNAISGYIHISQIDKSRF